jgi:Family of unknown function (DUF6071)
MLLYANGCSMTFGDEMGPPFDPICNQSAWPQHLGNLMGIPVVNGAAPGGSNDRIFRLTVKFIAQYLTQHASRDLRVVIGWTFPIRREFHDAECNHWYNFTPRNSRSAGPLTPVYCPTFCSEEEAIGRYYAQVLAMQGLLKEQGIAYTFFNAVWPEESEEPQQNCQWFPPEYVQLIDTSRYFLPDFHFGGWVRQHNYPCGRNNHPLHDAHRDWASAIYQAMWQ